MIQLATLLTFMIMPEPRSTMPGDRRMRQPHDGGDEHVERPLLVVDGAAEEGAVQAEPGVVHERLHRSIRVRQPAGDAVHVGALAQVGRQHLARHAVPLREVVRHDPQPLLVPRHEDEVEALAGEGIGESPADSCRGSGDQSRGHGPSLLRTGAVTSRPARALSVPAT